VLARFQQEATAAGRIGSPYIVDVLDVGTTPGGAPFLVMEKLRGRPLSAALAEHPMLPVPRALRIARQILAGVVAAHAAGIVHRDLKPDNIFLEDQGDGRDHVKLVDFGIAKVKDDPKVSHLTRTGMLLGTPRYMSPEQVEGRRDVDHRADIWAVGVILYECLTGRFPHEAPDVPSTLAAILYGVAPPPRALRPELEPSLEAAVLCALAKDPARRFPTAEAFRAALGPDPSLTPVAPAPSLPAASHRTGPEARTPFVAVQPPAVVPRRRTGPVLAAVLIAVVVAAGAVVAGRYLIGRDGGTPSRASRAVDATAAAPDAVAALPLAPVPDEAAERRLYVDAAAAAYCEPDAAGRARGRPLTSAERIALVPEIVEAHGLSYSRFGELAARYERDEAVLAEIHAKSLQCDGLGP
jgi:serine/threonine-protein kinase